MESQMHRPFGKEQEQEQEQPQHTGTGEVEQHEKKSVLKKVKAKAKKIKESIKHLGHEQEHGHDHDHHHEDDDDNVEEYDDSDEEMVDDPEVHGAPIYESTAIRSGVVPHQDVGISPTSFVNLENPSSRREDPLDSSITSEDKARRFVDPVAGQGRETAAERFTNVPPASGTSFHGGLERTEREPGTRFGVLTGLQEDPQAPTDKPKPSNYQTKVADPTGLSGEEAGVNPFVASFGKMTIENEAEPESLAKEAEENKSYTGSHDQFSPEPIPTSTHFGGPESTPKHFDSRKPEEEMPRNPIDGKSPGQGSANSGSYTDKISSAASVVIDKATAAKNVVTSKLGYTEEKGTTDSASTKSPKYSPTEYAHKAAAAVTETLAPVYGKVVGVGSAVVSKVPGIVADKGGEEGITESSPTEGNKARSVTMKEYLVEKLRPGEDDKALSEVISDTLHMHKAEGEETGERKPPIGKVTESEEVARRLGSGHENRREGSDAIIAGRESSGNTVVEKIKDAVTSWVVKGGESPTSHQGSPGDMEGSKNEVTST